MNLHVIEPNGNDIWEGNKNSKTKGQLQVMSNGTKSKGNVENVYWPKGSKAKSGTYTVKIAYFKCNNRLNPPSFTYTLRVKGNGLFTQTNGEIKFSTKQSNRLKGIAVAKFPIY